MLQLIDGNWPQIFDWIPIIGLFWAAGKTQDSAAKRQEWRTVGFGFLTFLCLIVNAKLFYIRWMAS